MFFIPLGLPRLCANLCERMLREGMHVHMGTFPATPMRAGGVRFCVNRNVTTADIDQLVERLRYHYPLVLEEEGSSCADVAHVFGLPLQVPPPPQSESSSQAAPFSLPPMQVVRYEHGRPK